MEKLTTIRVYADEDVDMTGEEFAESVVDQVSSMSGIESVEVEQVFSSPPVELSLRVEFNTNIVSEESLTFDISSLDNVHNAQ